MTDSEDHDYANANVANSDKQSNQAGSSKSENYKHTIPKECVLLIIRLFKEHFTELHGSNKRLEKRNAWAKIASVVQEHGYQMDAGQCNQKWRNMLRDYTMFIERLGQQTVDQPAGNPPWYFLQMADALNERQFLSVSDADSTVNTAAEEHSNSVDEMQQPFTIVPIASSIAVCGSVKHPRSSNQATTRGLQQTAAVFSDSSLANCNSDSDDDLAGNLASARKRKKKKDDSKPSKQLPEYQVIVEAIKEAEVARREDEDARHVALLQELRRQHYEKMNVLNKILDALENKHNSH